MQNNNNISSHSSIRIFNGITSTAVGVTQALGIDKQLSQLSTKMSELKDHYLTVDYLTTKAKDVVYAKVMPLSNPAGWEAKMSAEKTKIAVLKRGKSKLKRSLSYVEKRIKSSPKSRKKVLQKKQTKLTARYTQISENLKTSKKFVQYLKKQKLAQICSRFAGYFGMAANTILPGSGILIGVAFTGATAVAQEKLVDILPEDQDGTKNEKKNVRYGTLITVACTAASIAFSILAMPIIKETAWYLLNSTPSNLPV